MLRRIHKSVFLLLLSVLLAFSSGTFVFAVDVAMDFDKTGSITVTLRENDEAHTTVPGATFQIYRVADVLTEEGNLVYRFTSDFADCGMSLQNLNAEGLPEHLAGYTEAHGLTGQKKTAGQNGSVVFDELSLGLYLVTQEGAISGYYSITPFLTPVPMTNAEGTEWIYDVSAEPKVQPSPEPPEEYTHLTVQKVWDDNMNKNRPDYVEIQLFRDGKYSDTVKLNNQNGWKYSWTELDSSSRWSVTETVVPKGYTAKYSWNETAVTITNTMKSKTPDSIKPSDPLIKTGQLNWPIPVLAGVGLILFVLGWILTFIKRNRNEPQ